MSLYVNVFAYTIIQFKSRASISCGKKKGGGGAHLQTLAFFLRRWLVVMVLMTMAACLRSASL